MEEYKLTLFLFFTVLDIQYDSLLFVKRLSVQKLKHTLCNRIDIECYVLFPLFPKQQTVFYKSFLNAVHLFGLILAKMDLILKVWFLVTYVTLLNSQITNECTQLLTNHAYKATQNISGNCFVNCYCTLSICGNKERSP